MVAVFQISLRVTFPLSLGYEDTRKYLKCTFIKTALLDFCVIIHLNVTRTPLSKDERLYIVMFVSVCVCGRQ